MIWLNGFKGLASGGFIVLSFYLCSLHGLLVGELGPTSEVSEPRK